MLLFEVLRDDPNLGTGSIDATHKWCLPGVVCPHCGSTWGNVGLEYPTVDLSSLPNEKAYRPGPVPLHEFTELREPVVRLMGRSALLLPGTQFGPLLGNAKGRFAADFAWVNLWTVLATAESLAWLKERVPNLSAVRPELKFAGPDQPTLLELQLEPHGELILSPLSSGADPCSVCGWDPRPLPEKIVIDRSSITENYHLFRARNFNTLVLATDRFVKAVQDLGLVGLRFKEVTISD